MRRRNGIINLKDTSVFLSLVLRHKPQAAGITVDKHGWADVAELINGVNSTGKYHLDENILQEIVRTDSKQRYSYSDDKRKIRANQGHSIPVDVELKAKVPPSVLYHGTGEKYAAAIDQQGLLPKSRLYVHLSLDEGTAKIVGARHGHPIIYMIDTKRMLQDDFVFFESENHVWLTKSVPTRYLQKLNNDSSASI